MSNGGSTVFGIPARAAAVGPAGNPFQIQYHDTGGVFGATSEFYYTPSTGILNVGDGGGVGAGIRIDELAAGSPFISFLQDGLQRVDLVYQDTGDWLALNNGTDDIFYFDLNNGVFQTFDSTTAIGFQIENRTGALAGTVLANDSGNLYFQSDTNFIFTFGSEIRTYPGDGSAAVFSSFVHDGVSANFSEVGGSTGGFVFDDRITIDGALADGKASSMVMTDTATVGAFVGGGIQSLGTITYSSTTFIWALLQESKGYIANAAPGFAAFTLFNAIPFIRNGTNAGIVQALCLNVGISHQANGAVAVTTTQTLGMSFSPNTRALSAFGSMTKTVGDTAVNFTPTHGTVNLSSINHGTLTGLRMRNPAVALFQTGAGTESMTAYYGVLIDAIPFGGNVTKRGFQSNLVAASNTRAIDCAGTAQSDFGGTINMTADLVGIQYGASQDWFEAWAGGGFKIEQDAATAEQFRKSFPAAGRMLFDWSNDMELTINCVDGFSLGAQSGANGNQFGNFVTSARTIPVGGDWADFLLTQAGSLTVGGLAMGRVSAWVINPVSYANSTGSVGNADTLTVGGFPTSSPGVTITERQSLNVISGRSRHQAAMQFDPINPAALSSGNNNDWAGLLTGSANNGMRHWARIEGNATTSVLTGIDATAAQDGDSFELTNVSANSIDITHQDVASTAANRIITPSGVTYQLGADETVNIRYDATTARWRLLSGTGA